MIANGSKLAATSQSEVHVGRRKAVTQGEPVREILNGSSGTACGRAEPVAQPQRRVAALRTPVSRRLMARYRPSSTRLLPNTAIDDNCLERVGESKIPTYLECGLISTDDLAARSNQVACDESREAPWISDDVRSLGRKIREGGPHGLRSALGYAIS